VLPNGAQIRDQRPMPVRALAGCLVGMTPAEWYRLLNSYVFFWLDPARLDRQRAACAHRSQVVLAVDTHALIKRHAQRIALSPINSGNARRLAAPRCRATLVPYAQWLESGWASEAVALRRPVRARSHRPVELAVGGAVPDVMAMAVDVVHLGPSEAFAAGRKRARKR
jgi:hypothetical protein